MICAGSVANGWSNSRSATSVAASENSEKFTPSGDVVIPSGWAEPGSDANGRAISLHVPVSEGLAMLEDSRGDCPEDEATHMRHIRDPTGLHIGHGADLTEQLNEKPHADQQRGGHYGDAGEPA